MNGAPKVFETLKRADGTDRLREKFTAMWVKAEKVLQIPAINKLATEGQAGAGIVGEYAERCFERFHLFTWGEIAAAWDDTLIDLQRDQASGKFPAWNYGTLEAGLLRRLKPQPVLTLPQPEMTEEERRVNDLFLNPSEDFITEKIGQFIDHADNDRQYMLFGPHLDAIWQAIEARAGDDACRRARVDAKGDRLKYRRLILQAAK